MYTVLIHSDTGRRGDEINMVLELTTDESGRLDDLLSQTWRGKKPSLSRPDKVKITAKQVKWTKGLLRVGISLVAIQNLTKLSEYHVRGVRRGRYDFLLE
jgi:hypothetical protein